MKGIIASTAREFKLMFRNGISLYLAVAPALLALVFILVFGSIRNASLSLVIDGSIPADVAGRLGTIANIELVEDMNQLEKRVEGVDSIAGVTMADGTVRVIVEGNEGEGYSQSIQCLVSTALSAKGVEFRSEYTPGRGSTEYNISMISVFLMALFVGGATLGLGSVYERESGVIKAMSVSPMTLWRYVLMKLIPVSILSVLSVTVSALMIGKTSAIPQFILLALASVLMCGAIAFVIPAFAGNQLAAIGVLKLLMPVLMVLPISAAFVSDKWLVLYYALPMYWQYEAISAIISGKYPGRQFLLVLAASIPWFMAAVLLFAKKTKMRTWR